MPFPFFFFNEFTTNCILYTAYLKFGILKLFGGPKVLVFSTTNKFSNQEVLAIKLFYQAADQAVLVASNQAVLAASNQAVLAVSN